MREIKFRAWLRNGSGKWYMEYNPVLMCASTDVQIDNLDIAYLYFNDIARKIINLMQFTGLKDKNSNEVYEGDIYRNLDNGLIGKFYYLNGPGGYALHTRENNADGSPYNMLPFAQLDTTNFEVIGNIYETPELLEVNYATENTET